MANKQKDAPQKENKMFNAFSNPKMPSLFDLSKMVEMQKKNMDAMKQAQGVVSNMLKDISEANMQYMQKNLQEMQAAFKALTDEVQSKVKGQVSSKVHDNVAQMKQARDEMVVKLKGSKEAAMQMVSEKMQAFKEKHANLTEKLKASHHTTSEKLKTKVDEAKAHQSILTKSWHESTRQIMDLMKATANSHMN